MVFLPHIHPGYRFYAQVYSNNRELLCEKTHLTANQVAHFLKKYAKNNDWDLLDSLVVIPTNSCVSFIKALSVPTYLGTMEKTDNLWKVLSCITWDILTLPIRLLTLPYSVYKSELTPQKIHPVASLIKGHPLCKKVMKDNIVQLESVVESTRIVTRLDSLGNQVRTAIKTCTRSIRDIVLKKTPGAQGKYTTESTDSIYEQMGDGSWRFVATEPNMRSHD